VPVRKSFIVGVNVMGEVFELALGVVYIAKKGGGGT